MARIAVLVACTCVLALALHASAVTVRVKSRQDPLSASQQGSASDSGSGIAPFLNAATPSLSADTIAPAPVLPVGSSDDPNVNLPSPHSGRKKKGGKVTIITNTNDMRDIAKAPKQPSMAMAEEEDKKAMEREKEEETKRVEREQLQKRDRGEKDQKRRQEEAEKKAEQDKKQKEAEAEVANKKQQELDNKKEQQEKQQQEKTQKDNEREQAQKAEQNTKAEAAKAKAEQEGKAQAAEQAKKEADRAEQEKKRAAEEAASKRCRRTIKSPPGTFGTSYQTGVYYMPHGWNFAGDWEISSTAQVIGDINGDGLTDFGRLGRTYCHFFISNGQGGFFTPIYRYPSGEDFGAEGASWTTLKPMDVNGDKKMDFMRVSGTAAYVFMAAGDNGRCWNRNDWVPSDCFTMKVFHFRSGLNFNGVWKMGVPSENWVTGRTVYGDWNNDGKDDFAQMGATDSYFFTSRGDGTFYIARYVMPHGWNFGWSDSSESGYTTTALEFNADCKTDIMRFNGRTHYLFQNQGTNELCWNRDSDMDGNCFKTWAWGQPNGWNFVNVWSWHLRSFVLGDFNGDHRSDFAKLAPTYIHLFVSNGNDGFFFPVFYFPPGWNFGWNEGYWTSLPAADYDGDGRDDLIRNYYTYQHSFFPRGSNDDCWYTNRNPANSCFAIKTYHFPNGWNFSGGWTWNRRFGTMVGDWNGDGRMDFTAITGTALIYFYSQSY